MLYLNLKGSITYIIDGQLCPFRALESVKESNRSYISLTWHWHKRVMGWRSETDSFWGKNIKLEKDELTVLFNIVPQTAIETSITAKAPNDRPLGSNTRTNLMKENKNETKDGGWIETSGIAAAMFNCTSRINNLQQHNMDCSERQVGRKFHLNTYNIMREIQIVSYLNISKHDQGWVHTTKICIECITVINKTQISDLHLTDQNIFAHHTFEALAV